MKPTDACALVIIDVQQRLVPAMADVGPALVNMRRLIRGFQVLGRPVLATEQYPRGLGPTVPSLAQLMPGPYPAKVAFSCFGCAAFAAAVEPWETLVLAGLETHVCVLQTALDGLAAGRRMVVAADAVTSRRAADRQTALAQLAAAGATVTTSESILFGLLGQAGSEPFRAVARLVR